jgi:hypothetical protein
MWLTRTAGAWAISSSGTGSSDERNSQTQNARTKSMSAWANVSAVGTMSSTARRETASGWSSANR